LSVKLILYTDNFHRILQLIKKVRQMTNPLAFMGVAGLKLPRARGGMRGGAESLRRDSRCSRI